MGIAPALIAGAGAIGSGIAGAVGAGKAADASRETYDKEMKIRQQVAEMLKGLPGYGDQYLQYKPEDYQYIAEANPEYYKTPEEMQAATVSEDPKVREAEMGALAKMMEQSSGLQFVPTV